MENLLPKYVDKFTFEFEKPTDITSEDWFGTLTLTGEVTVDGNPQTSVVTVPKATIKIPKKEDAAMDMSCASSGFRQQQWTLIINEDEEE